MTDPRDLERLIVRELKRLPAPRAPRTLMPRVLAAVAKQEPAPWYSRPWATWPPIVQAFSLVLFAEIGAGLWTLWPHVPRLIAETGAPAAAAVMSRVASLTNQASQIAAVVRALWQVLLGPIAIFVLALTIIVSLACAAAWTAVKSVALGGASSQ